MLFELQGLLNSGMFPSVNAKASEITSVIKHILPEGVKPSAEEMSLTAYSLLRTLRILQVQEMVQPNSRNLQFKDFFHLLLLKFQSEYSALN